MTPTEIDFAMMQRERVVMPRGSIEIMRPMEIRGIAKVRRSQDDELRGKGGFYYEVTLSDSTGRGIINASPEQLDPAEPEKFAALWAEYKEFKRLREEYSKNGAGHSAVEP